MYLKDFRKYSINDKNAQGEFTLAFVTNDIESMIQWAGPFLRSIQIGTPELFLPTEETVQFWEQKSLQFLQKRLNEDDTKINKSKRHL